MSAQHAQGHFILLDDVRAITSGIFRWVVCVACMGEIRNVYQILYRKLLMEKTRLVHLVGFITQKFVTMHGHMNVTKNKIKS